MRYWFEYVDSCKTRHFETKEEADWFAHNEGDHLIAYGLYDRAFRERVVNSIIGSCTIRSTQNYFDLSDDDISEIMVEFGAECCSQCGWYIGEDDIADTDHDIVCIECADV